MKVFKFGGASTKDAQGLQNVVSILKAYQDDNLVLVISAMGKTTNALEKVHQEWCRGGKNIMIFLQEIKSYHENILKELFLPAHSIHDAVENLFVELEWALEENPEAYEKGYDQIVSFGELISSKIVSGLLEYHGIKNILVDARDIIKTDDNFREANIQWENTIGNGKKILDKTFNSSNIIVTQGFIGGAPENYTSTLGREGSDYSAAIVAFMMDAKEVVIWKDVPGVLNADPRFYEETTPLEFLSYQDAIELAYYGATVIHPKTIKPLQNKSIPLKVKSFIDPEIKGTLISNEKNQNHQIPNIIFKFGQILVSLMPKDFSFIVEENIGRIFNLFAAFGIKVNMMQNSAISFSVCINETNKLPELVEKLRLDYRVLYNVQLKLITIRNYNDETLNKVTLNHKVLLEQKSRSTIQVVIQEIGN